MAPAIAGVLETCLYVDDMARARAFYQDVLGLDPMVSEDRLTVYDAGPAMALILFQRGGTLDTVRLPGGTVPFRTEATSAWAAVDISARRLCVGYP